MDQFLKVLPELGIYSRQELARRAIADWMLEKRRVLRGSNSPEYSAVIKEIFDRITRLEVKIGQIQC